MPADPPDRRRLGGTGTGIDVGRCRTTVVDRRTGRRQWERDAPPIALHRRQRAFVGGQAAPAAARASDHWAWWQREVLAYRSGLLPEGELGNGGSVHVTRAEPLRHHKFTQTA